MNTTVNQTDLVNELSKTYSEELISFVATMKEQGITSIGKQQDNISKWFCVTFQKITNVHGKVVSKTLRKVLNNLNDVSVIINSPVRDLTTKEIIEVFKLSNNGNRDARNYIKRVLDVGCDIANSIQYDIINNNKMIKSLTDLHYRQIIDFTKTLKNPELSIYDAFILHSHKFKSFWYNLHKTMKDTYGDVLANMIVEELYKTSFVKVMLSLNKRINVKTINKLFDIINKKVIVMLCSIWVSCLLSVPVQI